MDFLGKALDLERKHMFYPISVIMFFLREFGVEIPEQTIASRVEGGFL